ncbi:hypothetical protein TNCV_76061 [Trichonephila clavipes]|nr:hypothetical protein TNCV_76061 [Trichonephila clavipes]
MSYSYAVNFLHHANPPSWAGVEPATLGAEDQRQTNHATQTAIKYIFTGLKHSRKKYLLIYKNTNSSLLTAMNNEILNDTCKMGKDLAPGENLA